MEGLLRRLSDGDAEAEDALRVVLYFDRLVASRAGISDLLMSASRLIGGAAGYSPAGTAPVHEAVAFDESGEAASIPTNRRRTRAIDTRLPSLGEVWIEEVDLSLGDLVVERLAIAAGIILARIGAVAPSLDADPVLVLIDDEAGPIALYEAGRALKLRAEWKMRVLVCWSPLPQNVVRSTMTTWAETSGIQHTPFIVNGDLVVGLVRGETAIDEDSLPAQILVASGPRRETLESAASYAGARQAIRLTSLQLGPTFLDYEKLGPLIHIASLHPEVAGSTELVRMFQFMMQTPAGQAELVALDSFCRLGGLRAAAASMHMHHSSLSSRLKNAENRLSLSLRNPQSRLQITLALQLLRSTQWAVEADRAAEKTASMGVAR